MKKSIWVYLGNDDREGKVIQMLEISPTMHGDHVAKPRSVLLGNFRLLEGAEVNEIDSHGLRRETSHRVYIYNMKNSNVSDLEEIGTMYE